MSCGMIILNYKDYTRAYELAKKCTSYDQIDHIIIVDNNSSDCSYEWLQEKIYGKIEMVKAEKNNGFASGNNIGAKYMVKKYDPEILLFANTDTIFNSSDIEACINELNKHNDLGLVSMRMKDIKGNEERVAWKFKTFAQYTLFNIWIYKHMTYKKDCYHDFQKNFQYVDIVRGSFMCFKTKALVSVEFFDENTFLYYEEEIIAMRLKQVGYKVGILTDHFYIHNHIQNGKSNKWFVKKNLDSSLYHFLTTYYQINMFKKVVYKAVIRFANLETVVIDMAKRVSRH